MTDRVRLFAASAVLFFAVAWWGSVAHQRAPDLAMWLVVGRAR